MKKQNSAKAKAILYTSKKLKDGSHPVSLRLTHKGKRYYYTTGYHFTKDLWNRIMSDNCPPSLEETKLEIIGIQAEAIKTKNLVELELGFFTISEFEKRFFFSNEEIPLINALQKTLDRCEIRSEIAPRTVKSYNNALSALRRFERHELSNGRKTVFYLQEVTKEFVSEFESYLKSQTEKDNSTKKNCGITTIGIYTASFKALYNRVIRRSNFTPPVHPFCDHKRKKGSTSHRGLSKEDIIRFYKYPSEKGTPEWLAQQYFIFCYLNQGMNFTDLAKLRWSDIGEKRLVYTRNKTKEHIEPDTFSIRVSDETRTILDYFYARRKSNLDYVFPILSENNYSPKREIEVIDNKSGGVNDYLEKIGEAIGVQQKITTYVARHTYATTLLNNDVPLHVIQEKLGHKEMRTTRGYAKRLQYDSLDKVDENLLKL